ncbi:MAG TPA: hypothetical protein VFI68_10055 [Anaerolineales bacterium]|nr:hypothetical protein [Anaerolineales bacterium]
MSVTFQPPSRSLTPRDYLFIALVVVVFTAVCAGLVFANLTLKGGGGDFYTLWAGSRSFLFDKVDPYGAEVPARVQQLVYERSAGLGDEPYFLVTPFHILPFYYPFALLSDPKLARAIFTSVLELSVIMLAILSLRLTDWEAPRFYTILIIFFAIFNFYTIQAIYEANPVLILGLLFAGILLALRAEMDELAGALIAFSLFYWEVGAPFIFLVFLRVYYEKRTRVFAGFIMLSFVLFIVSFLSYPNWIIPFMRSTVNNLRAEYGFNIHTILIHIWPSQGRVLAWVFITVLFIILGYEWSSARKGDDRHFYWASCLSLTAAPLLGFRTEMENLSVLIIPLALILAVIHGRWYRFGNSLALLLMSSIFAAPWMLYLFAVNRFGSVVQDIIFLLLPLITLVGLYWIRWWAIRPPRTWKDLANKL